MSPLTVPTPLGALLPVAAVGLTALAAGLVLPARVRAPAVGAETSPGAPAADDQGLVRRFRALWTVLAGLGPALLLGGVRGPVVGVVAAALVWWVVGRSEPAAQRRRREQIARDLPDLVDLLSSALDAGAAPEGAVASVAAAMEGPAGGELAALRRRLDLGVDPVQAWRDLARHPQLAPLGRAIARAVESGSSVAEALHRLAVDQRALARSETEARARSVGVKAAAPLGLCLLPAFVLVGIVPLVVSALGTIRLG